MLNSNQMIDKALEIAINVHKDTLDKGGIPYILHPLRVMNNCKSLEAKTVALLHDTIEDSFVDKEYLEKNGFSSDIIEAVMLLTHKSDIPYFEYVRNLKDNALAREVKLRDLEDNMNIFRIPEVGDEDLKRLAKYRRAYEYLKLFDEESIKY